jgi:acetyl-CoA C-acetyltransferase
MTTIDPRTPVVVGVGQHRQRIVEPTAALEQYRLMEEALRAAESDSGAALLGALDEVVAIGGMWRYPDPGRLVADAVGATGARTLLTTMGGNMPQTTLNDAAVRIAEGSVGSVAIVGGEAVYSKNKLRAMGLDLPRSGRDLAPARRFGSELPMSSEHEIDRGFTTPTEVYPLFESAIRASRQESHADHRDRIARLWEGLNAVAVANPHAWSRDPMTADEIRDPSPTNRMVGYPYTKVMNANSFVDFGAAVVLCSAERAESLGIQRDRWVFPVAGAEGCATHRFSERFAFHDSPAIRETGRLCLELAGLGVDDLGPIDLYSCFPSAVQITMAELGLSDDRRVTTTGGLTFFGGPMNSYVLHAIASTIDEIRESGDPGLVHGNGGYLTKQSFGIYSATPPESGFRCGDAQPAIDAHPRRKVDEAPQGGGKVESYTVVFGRAGPDRALLTALMPDGRRALASTGEPEVMGAMTTEELVGHPVDLSPQGSARFS